MAGGAAWSRRGAARARTLRGLLRDTLRALDDAADVIPDEAAAAGAVRALAAAAARGAALVLLGAAAARRRLLRALLGRPLLPPPSRAARRWIRISYGAQAAVHLSVGGSEFELVGELRGGWGDGGDGDEGAESAELAEEDILRTDKDDLSTILEVELKSQFLKDGLKILLPPDLGPGLDPGLDPGGGGGGDHREFYESRAAVLNTVNPIYICAVDRFGSPVFPDAAGDGGGGGGGAVFGAEEMADLRQVKALDAQAPVLFVLLAGGGGSGEKGGGGGEGTDVGRNEEDSRTAAATACGSELLERWNAMYPPSSKYSVQSQFIVVEGDWLDPESPQPAPPHPGSPHSGSPLPGSPHPGSPHNAPPAAANVNAPTPGKRRRGAPDRAVRSRTQLLGRTLKFAGESYQGALLGYCTSLSELHARLLQGLVLASWDLARELQLVPRMVRFVAERERQLYETIQSTFVEGARRRRLLRLAAAALDELRADLAAMDWSGDDLPCHRDREFLLSNSSLEQTIPDPVEMSGNTDTLGKSDTLGNTDTQADSRCSDESDAEEALSYDSFNIDEYEVIDSNDESLSEYGLSGVERDGRYRSIRVETEASLESAHAQCRSASQMSRKQATLDVHRTVLSQLSRKLSLRLADYIHCLRETYVGTLHRCVESLEQRCAPAAAASAHLRRLTSPRLSLPAGLLRAPPSVRDLLRRLLVRMGVAAARDEAACCPRDARWRRRTALAAAGRLSARALAAAVSQQILDNLSECHERWAAAARALEAALGPRLRRAEDLKLDIRKRYAPTFAQLCLESTSMCDLLTRGAPTLGREIGRGQYGVVYAARGPWGGRSVAVKSVAAADERHYRDLAMEFFYTRSIPPHPRIVRLLGSIVLRPPRAPAAPSGSAGGAGAAGAPGVLLVCERRVRDLHAAVRAGLSYAKRMRIAVDIVEGIRYLHSLGLVHRDVKMKNVLLDQDDRASLTDLGFCAASALMSGSVVGTPVHMAPELLRADYSAAVDVYAFGILFWYLCAGSVRLPANFEAFQNKEQLWSKVRKGLRPERLAHFSDECWAVMQACWAAEPARRALLGDVQPRLEALLRAGGRGEREGEAGGTGGEV